MDETTADKELAYWFALLRAPGVDSVALHSLMHQYKSPLNIFGENTESLSRFGLSEKTIRYLTSPHWDRVEKDLEWHRSPDNYLITYQDKRYPDLLKEIPDPPLALYLSGDPYILTTLQISIVGSRRPTPDGRRNTKDFASQLARSGVTITSGLAAGLDSEAHLATLEAGGRTIAVFGSGLNVIYPAKNRDLSQLVAQNGAIISELPPDYSPRPMNFPRRNRIISGLCVGTLVVEAAEKSGSLITAKFAMEQGREVFAVPGSINNPMARGCHGLIRQGAKLVENINDILEEIGPLAHVALNSRQKLSNDGKKLKDLDECSKLLLDNIGSLPVSIDFLVEKTNLTVSVVSSLLQKLELSGVIESTPGGKYIRFYGAG